MEILNLQDGGCDENRPPSVPCRQLAVNLRNIAVGSSLEDRVRRLEGQFMEFRRKNYLTREEASKQLDLMQEQIVKLGRDCETRSSALNTAILRMMKTVRKQCEDLDRKTRRVGLKGPRSTCRMCKKELSKYYIHRHMNFHCAKAPRVNEL